MAGTGNYLNQYFHRDEFACKCGCGFNTVDAELLRRLTKVRTHFGAVKVTSGCRCPEYNKKVGGSPKSQHLLGRAADIQVLGISPREVADYIDQEFPTGGGLGRYDSFTHVDSRDVKARWGKA